MKKYRVLSLLTSVSLIINAFAGGSVANAAESQDTDQNLTENESQIEEEDTFDGNSKENDIANDGQESSGGSFEEKEDEAAYTSLMSYYEYLAQFPGAEQAGAEIEIDAADFISEEGSDAYLASYQGKDQVLYWDSQHGMVTWEFEAPETGLYQLQLEYCPIACKNYDIAYDVYIDGAIPYENAKSVLFKRSFMDDTYLTPADNSFAKDTAGNEIRPAMSEIFGWTTAYAHDAKNQVTEPVSFYLESGSHTVSLKLTVEAAALSRIVFSHEAELPDYASYLQQTQDSAGTASDYSQKYEAEKSYQKNDITLFATYDTGSVNTTPSSPTKILYNTIGKNTWNEVGENITWQIEAPEDGYYCFSFKVKQNEKTNAYSVRNMTIDGACLFEEMNDIKFSYDSSWYMKDFEDENGTPYQIYLTKGTHTLGMEAAMDSEFADMLRRVDEVNSELEQWYREIVKITGMNADSSRITVDTNRDFHLDQNIPGLLEGLSGCSEELKAIYAELGDMEQISTSSASILSEMSVLLDSLVKKPGKIASRIETFRSNISTLATWTIDMQQQPLVMDSFTVYTPDQQSPVLHNNFWKQLWYRFMMFLNSFVSQSTSIAGTSSEQAEGRTITVWISTADITTTGASSGRDQAIILKRLIDESFSTQHGINVSVSLVSGSDTLTQAVLAGEGPDVALFTSMDTPVNLAMRGAVMDLSQYEDYDEITKQFTESATVPFRYKDGYYAFPETQSFNVLFYRTDILSDLGMEPPTTWEEFYQDVVLLANENYMVGIPQNQNSFETFLYQTGQTFYNQTLTQSSFDTNESLQAFQKWTDLYDKYSLSLVFDFFNRFRAGEMAMAIEPYSQCNYLYSAAPELNGLWDMAVIPGTVMEDGSINHVETSSTTGSIVLADTKYPDESYEFLKWWVSADTQAQFGTQVEQTLGVAARYTTANLEAFESIPWSESQAEVLRTQREYITAVEQIPGSYYIARNLAFAFRAVVYNHANVRETLYKYNIEINKELKRKQKEFNY